MFALQISQMDVEGVKTTAVRVLFDLLQLFGLDAFGVESKLDESQQGVASHTIHIPITMFLYKITMLKHTWLAADESRDESSDGDDVTAKSAWANSVLNVLVALLDSQVRRRR